eukprot:TRINITY_DN8266_c0_g1_i1.p1 TRINITY_DN8266_c0_g1~~TRINITY_DN8266_c0_g1_i1.p1  ORF type:complete len:173 (+),score=70.08 TRINITY_DN8266_c0_g1_i1:31-549(+)
MMDVVEGGWAYGAAEVAGGEISEEEEDDEEDLTELEGAWATGTPSGPQLYPEDKVKDKKIEEITGLTIEEVEGGPSAAVTVVQSMQVTPVGEEGAAGGKGGRAKKPSMKLPRLPVSQDIQKKKKKAGPMAKKRRKKQLEGMLKALDRKEQLETKIKKSEEKTAKKRRWKSIY